MLLTVWKPDVEKCAAAVRSSGRFQQHCRRKITLGIPSTNNIFKNKILNQTINY